MIKIHPHALQRSRERGTTEEEINLVVQTGEAFSAKFNRTGFRLNISFNSIWNENFYQTKQIEAYAVKKNNEWLVITVIVKYF
jgi:hypothetical protein